MCGISAGVYAAVTAVMAVVGTGVSVYSSVQQGKQAEGVAEYNARVAENEAQDARNLATEKENAHRLKVAQTLSTQRAQLGAGNIELGSGSALQLQQDTATLGEADALRIRTSGDSSVDALNQSAYLTSVEGSNAVTQGYVNAGSSLLSGASQTVGIADKWYNK